LQPYQKNFDYNVGAAAYECIGGKTGKIHIT